MQDSRRALTTEKLKKAGVGHFVKKRYAVYSELGLVKRARYRADLVCFNYKKEIIVVEIKSCLADFKADNKWQQYLSYCDKLYFLIPESLWVLKRELLVRNLKGRSGILILSEATGYIKVVLKAPTQSLTEEVRNMLIVRMAYRADFTKRNTKRYKVFLA